MKSIEVLGNYTGCLIKKHPLLTKQRAKNIYYGDFLSSYLHLLIFNLNTHTLHFEIVPQTREIRVNKVKIVSALETRDLQKGLAMI